MPIVEIQRNIPGKESFAELYFLRVDELIFVAYPVDEHAQAEVNGVHPCGGFPKQCGTAVHGLILLYPFKVVDDAFRNPLQPGCQHVHEHWIEAPHTEISVTLLRPFII